MNGNPHPIDDQELADALREESNMPRPSAEHVSDLRALLLERTEPDSDNRPEIQRTARPRRRWLSLGIGVAIAASLLVAVLPSVITPSNVFADVLAKARQQTWTHAVSIVQHGDQKAEFEMWYSPVRRIAAMRRPTLTQFDDYSSGVSTRFKPDAERIYKTRATTAPNHLSSDSFIEALMSESGNSDLFPMQKASKPKKSTVVIDGKEWTQYSFRVEHMTDANRSRRIRLRLDAETELPVEWEERHSNGTTVTTRFDYPEQGPTDIYALGVPRSAEVVDRVASSDVTKIAASLRKGRTQFDDYDGIFMQHTDGRDSSPLARSTLIRRVRRQGNKYRVDDLLQVRPGVEPPGEDADLTEWWKQNRNNFWSVPTLICDGRTYTTYLMVDGRLPKEGKPNLEVELRMKNPISGRLEDPSATWPHLMPEFNSRPHLWTTIDTRSFEFEPLPDDGPKDSVRVAIRTDDPVAPVRARYWCDPAHGFCVVKSVVPVMEKKNGKRQIAYMNTEVFENFAQSPSGLWYPRQSRRTTTRTEVTQVRRYFLDFDVEFDSSSFKPLDLND